CLGTGGAAVAAARGTGKLAKIIGWLLNMMNDVTLTGRHLVRTFGDGDTQTTALDDVSLELYRGQFALLMGPSGSGKSTLLAVLSGLLHPSAGQVTARDRDRTLDIWQMSDKEREEFRLRHCGYIFQ